MTHTKVHVPALKLCMIIIFSNTPIYKKKSATFLHLDVYKHPDGHPFHEMQITIMEVTSSV